LFAGRKKVVFVTDCCAVIYAEILRDVPTTLAPWEEVEAKIKSNGLAASSRTDRTQNQAEVDGDEFVLLSQQLHKNVTASSASTSPVTPDASASNGGMLVLVAIRCFVYSS